MGDRSNVFVQMYQHDDGWTGIGFYAHWGGLEMHEDAIEAARGCIEQLGDAPHFTRRMMQKLMAMQSDPSSETAAGLWVEYPCDNEHPILVINADSGLAWRADKDSYRLPAPDFATHVDAFEFADG